MAVSSLITMVAYDTIENNRTWMTRVTLETLRDTVDWGKHQLAISDNGSCKETLELYEEFKDIITWVSYNGENLGTAKALNLLWRHRQPYHASIVKIDNDVRLHDKGWLDLIEMVFKKDPVIGICGLKRHDLDEWPDPMRDDGKDKRRSFYVSTLRWLPHKLGEPWLIVEECEHVMGTCQAYSKSLLDKFGYLWQPKLYGLDDSLAAYRAHLLGYKTVFLHTAVHIDHVDPGQNPFVDWKQKIAGEVILSGDFDRLKEEYRTGKRLLYYDGGFNE